MTEENKNEMIEISEEDQAIFDKSVKTCSTIEGRLKTIKHAFKHYAEVDHTILTINEVLRLVAHPCIGKIEITDEESLEKMEQLKKELMDDDMEWWKMASMTGDNTDATI